MSRLEQNRRTAARALTGVVLCLHGVDLLVLSPAQRQGEQQEAQQVFVGHPADDDAAERPRNLLMTPLQILTKTTLYPCTSFAGGFLFLTLTLTVFLVLTRQAGF